MTARLVPTQEKQAAEARRLFEMMLAGANFSEAATSFHTTRNVVRTRFFGLARMTARRRSPAHQYEIPLNERSVTMMRKHKETWLRAYDQALKPLSLIECQTPETVSIAQLRLTSQTEACLRRARIETLADLLNKTEKQIMINRMFGKKRLREIKQLLTRLGLSFPHPPD